jgi:predicted transcriptional regulator
MMSVAEIKNELHRLVVETDDQKVLQQIKSIFVILKKGGEETDWWDLIDEKEKVLIKKGLQQLERGERISHQEVRKDIDLLLKK